MESGPPMERERQHSLALLPRSCFSDLAVGRRFTDPLRSSVIARSVLACAPCSIVGQALGAVSRNGRLMGSGVLSHHHFVFFSDSLLGITVVAW